ncbi:MAG: helicase C-terminal domain-containing protein, partial [Candidatus Hydrogenedentales bacterium]
EPVLQARAEAIEAAGGNAFMDYTVPLAVIKLRQGFGRLIRRRSDRGSILVLDKRVLTKQYGKLFLSSLPDAGIVRGPQRGVLAALKRFHQSEEWDA